MRSALVANGAGKLVIGEAVVDPARGLLLDKEGNVVPLRRKSFDLLKFLSENAGRTVSRDELLNAIWPGVTVTDESVTQCVREVRQAIGDPQGQVLRTIPRRGYLLDVQLPTSSPLSAVPAILPNRPSIAVLPFTNMSGDPEQEYFCDGIVEDITSALSHFPRLLVIARNSAFTYKGRSVDVRAIGAELSVRYVLQGSVRKAGGRVRITGQLIETEAGSHLWADRVEGLVEDVFDLQDQVTASVVGAIAPKLLEAEIERTARKRPGSLDAYDLYLRALRAMREMTREGNDRTLSLVEQALTIEPRYAVAAALGAWGYTLRIPQNWPFDPAHDRVKGVELAHRAIADGQDDSDALAMGGYSLGFLGERIPEGLIATERAIMINTNNALAYANSGWLRAYLGQAERAIRDLEQAIRLSPRDPALFRAATGLAFALLFTGNFDAAIKWGLYAIEANPNYSPAHRVLASALAHAGREEDARRVVSRLRDLVPGLTISKFAHDSLFRYSGRLEYILEGLRKAGLPE